jgi:hypothetical protein
LEAAASREQRTTYQPELYERQKAFKEQLEYYDQYQQELKLYQHRVSLRGKPMHSQPKTVTMSDL